MTNSIKNLPLDGRIHLIEQMAEDFLSFAQDTDAKIPAKMTYKIASSRESSSVLVEARMAALKRINADQGIVKVAFDTRRVNQETARIPRKNLQFWNRSQQFLEEEDSRRLETFAQLAEPLKEIQDTYMTHPEYFNSYSRILYDTVKRALRVSEGDLDIYRPQLDYLEQLLFTRYRLSLEDISSMQKVAIKDRILSKDEDLLKRGSYLDKTRGMMDEPPLASNAAISKDGNGGMQDSIVNAIFGNNKFRREGEKTVERTITITIRDEVVE